MTMADPNKPRTDDQQPDEPNEPVTDEDHRPIQPQDAPRRDGEPPVTGTIEEVGSTIKPI
jgi:hypothetical protein